MTSSTTAPRMPFWRPARGKTGVLLYLVSIHILAIIGLVLFPLPSLPVLGVASLLAALGGLGTTVGYLRVDLCFLACLRRRLPVRYSHLNLSQQPHDFFRPVPLQRAL